MTVSILDAPPPMRGANFVRMISALGAAKGDPASAAAIAAGRFGPVSVPVAMLQKASVSPGTSSDATWGAPLVDAGGIGTEFFGLVKEKSVLGTMPNLRRVPLGTTLLTTVTGPSASWTAETAAKPVSAATYTSGKLERRKVSVTVIVAGELLRLASVDAELAIRNDMTTAIAQALDEAFLNPANAGDATKPASVLNGITPITSGGTPDADVKALTAAFNGDLGSASFVCTPAIGAALASTTRPNSGARGGEIAGIPLLCSSSSPAGQLALIDGSVVAYGEAGIFMSSSSEGSVHMQTAPDSPTTAATVLASLWALNWVGLRAELHVGWELVQPTGAALVTGITWA
jgi:hypothetical protein